MATKEAFLSTVRAALADGQGPSDAPLPEHVEPASTQEEVQQRATDLRKGLAKKRDVLLTQLQGSAALQEWNLVIVSSDAEAREAIIGIAIGLEARTMVRTAHPAVERLGLDEAFGDKGVESVLLASSSTSMSPQQLQEIAARADLGITGADHLIAETASVSLVSREGASRMASLLPPVHIAVVQLDQVVETLGDLLTLREAELARESSSSWYMNLVSGPSRTADIEQTIVVGVHGPGEVHLVVITG